MEPPFPPLSVSIVLFVGMTILFAAGRKLGLRRHLEESPGERESLGTIEGALFGMFALLMAFTFSGAAQRFSEKKALINQEVGFTRTAYLRLQLVPENERVALEELFRRYVDSRLETYRRLPDIQAATQEVVESKRLQKAIWAKAVAAARLPNADRDVQEVLLPAINDMINIAATRIMAVQAHPPRIVFELLFVLGLMCSLLAGYHTAGGRKWNWLHLFSFTLITVIVVYVILDMEYPRGGLINVQNADQMLISLREDMN